MGRGRGPRLARGRWSVPITGGREEIRRNLVFWGLRPQVEAGETAFVQKGLRAGQVPRPRGTSSVLIKFMFQW